jgi:hypothetical protein
MGYETVLCATVSAYRAGPGVVTPSRASLVGTGAGTMRLHLKIVKVVVGGIEGARG